MSAHGAADLARLDAALRACVDLTDVASAEMLALSAGNVEAAIAMAAGPRLKLLQTKAQVLQNRITQLQHQAQQQQAVVSCRVVLC